MKYAKFSDEFLSYFRLDDNGETLVLTDKQGYTRAVKLLTYEENPPGDLISREALKKTIDKFIGYLDEDMIYRIKVAIDKVPTVEDPETPFITECRNAAIEQNLPLYFVYYEETGILEVYVTETKELFEKRRCSKHLPDHKFKEAVIKYLDWYSDWKVGSYER